MGFFTPFPVLFYKFWLINSFKLLVSGGSLFSILLSSRVRGFYELEAQWLWDSAKNEVCGSI